MNNKIKFNLNVSILREGNKFIAFSPALDLSTCGDTYEQAKKRFSEASELFFEEIIKEKTFGKALSNLGWQKERAQWSPPVVVAQEYQTICIPIKQYGLS